MAKAKHKANLLKLAAYLETLPDNYEQFDMGEYMMVRDGSYYEILGIDERSKPSCDMIAKHEQPPVDRKLLCAREAVAVWERSDEDIGVEDACLHAIELYERGFGK